MRSRGNLNNLAASSSWVLIRHMCCLLVTDHLSTGYNHPHCDRSCPLMAICRSTVSQAPSMGPNHFLIQICRKSTVIAIFPSEYQTPLSGLPRTRARRSSVPDFQVLMIEANCSRRAAPSPRPAGSAAVHNSSTAVPNSSSVWPPLVVESLTFYRSVT